MPQYATCPKCSSKIRINKNGEMRSHKKPDTYIIGGKPGNRIKEWCPYSGTTLEEAKAGLTSLKKRTMLYVNGQEYTRWNYQPALAMKCRVIVGNAGTFPEYWAKDLVGQEIDAVEVSYNRKQFYLDNRDGSGWYKVTNGGGPDLPHRDLDIERLVRYIGIPGKKSE